jgi:hypothetical protein
VNEFFEVLNDPVDEDYLQELSDANDDGIIIVGAPDLVENWTCETVTALIHAEIETFKAVKGIKLQAPDTCLFNCP